MIISIILLVIILMIDIWGVTSNWQFKITSSDGSVPLLSFYILIPLIILVFYITQN